MLEKFIVTLTVTSLSLGVGSTYVWAQGGFDAASDLAPSSQRLLTDTLPADASAPTGYGRSTPRVLPAATPAAAPAAAAPAEVASPAPWQPVPLVAPDLAPLPLPGPVSQAAPAAARVAPAPPATANAAPSLPSSTTSSTTTGTTAGTTTGTTDVDEAEPTPDEPTPTGTGGTAEFTVASFNILASKHTRGRSSFAPGVARVAGALEVLRKHDVSVVGFQEFEADQRREFARLARGWESFPGPAATQSRAGFTTVAWDGALWEAEQTRLIDIPFLKGGGERPMPYVLLRHRETGKQVWFSSFHNSSGRGAAQARRQVASARQIALANRLEATGHPYVMTGDMNEREGYFCRITGQTSLVAAVGGRHDGRCRPPKQSRIDWIFGSPTLRFSGYQADRSDRVRRVTDHPVLVSRVRVGG